MKEPGNRTQEKDFHQAQMDKEERSMNALEVLKQDHQKVKGLFQEIRHATDEAKRKELFDKIDTELEIHAPVGDNLLSRY